MPLSFFSRSTSSFITLHSAPAIPFVHVFLFGFLATEYKASSRSHWSAILLCVCVCVLLSVIVCLCVYTVPEIIIRAGAHMRCCHHSAHSCRTQCLRKMNMTFWGEATPSHADLHLSFPACVLFLSLGPLLLPPFLFSLMLFLLLHTTFQAEEVMI